MINALWLLLLCPMWLVLGYRMARTDEAIRRAKEALDRCKEARREAK